ncbi:PAS domain-containing sensor histidine kinase [Sesbania bispinosa]|nr:PAS domain-containing sensor histidine kinase [Sesbania bispinosa]
MKFFEKARRDKISLKLQRASILENNVMNIDDDTLAFVQSRQKSREELERAHKPPNDNNPAKGDEKQDIEHTVDVVGQGSINIVNHANHMEEEHPSEFDTALADTS